MPKILQNAPAHSYATAPYIGIYTVEIETKFLETQNFLPLVLFQYIYMSFLTWAYGKKELKQLMNNIPNLKFAYE